MRKKILEEVPEHYKIVKGIIYKIYDEDDASIEPLYFTLKGLRNHVVNVLWDEWNNVMDTEQAQEFTKEEIVENDEYLFAYLEVWRYKIERITFIDLK